MNHHTEMENPFTERSFDFLADNDQAGQSKLPVE
jgi:hypothetical protein